MCQQEGQSKSPACFFLVVVCVALLAGFFLVLLHTKEKAKHVIGHCRSPSGIHSGREGAGLQNVTS